VCCLVLDENRLSNNGICEYRAGLNFGNDWRNEAVEQHLLSREATIVRGKSEDNLISGLCGEGVSTGCLSAGLDTVMVTAARETRHLTLAQGAMSEVADTLV